MKTNQRLKGFFFIIILASLSSCMNIRVIAREGSTVTVNQSKPVTVTTDAEVPIGVLP